MVFEISIQLPGFSYTNSEHFFHEGAPNLVKILNMTLRLVDILNSTKESPLNLEV